ncbi:hypothetical protein [Candidatus Clostridium stratigraminis]|uniref:Glycerophosphoryl diester phosphodiesterase membrane domain-containing protein n=1 Tax=Candidatus Clostridium stratigraminis TaxID=3381661 RepID=A0ABW8T7S9_9CLOT
MRFMNLSEIMDRSIDILRKNIKSIALFSFGYTVIEIIGIILVSIIISIFGAITVGIFHNVAFAAIIISVFILFLAAFLISYCIGIIRISSGEFTEEKIYAHTAIKASFKSLFKVYAIIIIGTIALLPVLAAFGGLGYVLANSFNINSINNISNVNTVIGKGVVILIVFILYILAAIFAVLAVLNWFLFSLHTLAIENIGVVNSIKRSFYLVRKDYLRILGASILFTLTVTALRLSVDLILGTASSIIYLLLKFFSVKQDYIGFLSMIYNYTNWPLSIIVLMVITPINVIMLTMLYYNQRFKKEGYDLELRLREIELKNEREQVSETN